MIGRRVDSVEAIEQPGDYYMNPLGDGQDETRSLWFWLPGERPREGFTIALSRIAEPPWVFRECADGSIEVRESILRHDYTGDDPAKTQWHGYLDEGHVWREC